MIPTLKAEFKKLLTIRSTYIITILAILLIAFISFYASGIKLDKNGLNNPGEIASDATGALNTAIVGAVIAVLLITHEYRYNTITYSLTNSNSRSKVLLAKIVVISLYALLFAVAVGFLSPALSVLGIHFSGHTLIAQKINYGNLIWRCLFYGWSTAMAGLVIALLARNQVASIVAVFVIPDIIEELLGLLLKHNTVYLPFHALNQVLNFGSENGLPTSSNLSPGKAAMVFCVYLVVSLSAAWYLFLKRDAI